MSRSLISHPTHGLFTRSGCSFSSYASLYTLLSQSKLYIYYLSSSGNISFLLSCKPLPVPMSSATSYISMNSRYTVVYDLGHVVVLCNRTNEVGHATILPRVQGSQVKKSTSIVALSDTCFLLNMEIICNRHFVCFLNIFDIDNQIKISFRLKKVDKYYSSLIKNSLIAKNNLCFGVLQNSIDVFLLKSSNSVIPYFEFLHRGSVTLDSLDSACHFKILNFCAAEFITLFYIFPEHGHRKIRFKLQVVSMNFLSLKVVVLRTETLFELNNSFSYDSNWGSFVSFTEKSNNLNSTQNSFTNFAEFLFKFDCCFKNTFIVGCDINIVFDQNSSLMCLKSVSSKFYSNDAVLTMNPCLLNFENFTVLANTNSFLILPSNFIDIFKIVNNSLCFVAHHHLFLNYFVSVTASSMTVHLLDQNFKFFKALVVTNSTVILQDLESHSLVCQCWNFDLETRALNLLDTITLSIMKSSTVVALNFLNFGETPSSASVLSITDCQFVVYTVNALEREHFAVENKSLVTCLTGTFDPTNFSTHVFLQSDCFYSIIPCLLPRTLKRQEFLNSTDDNLNLLKFAVLPHFLNSSKKSTFLEFFDFQCSLILSDAICSYKTGSSIQNFGIFESMETVLDQILNLKLLSSQPTTFDYSLKFPSQSFDFDLYISLDLFGKFYYILQTFDAMKSTSMPICFLTGCFSESNLIDGSQSLEMLFARGGHFWAPIDRLQMTLNQKFKFLLKSQDFSRLPLYLFLSNKSVNTTCQVLATLHRQRNENLKYSFYTQNFSSEKAIKSATASAFAAMSRLEFEFAAFLFILAGNYNDGCSALVKGNLIELSVVVGRIFKCFDFLNSMSSSFAEKSLFLFVSGQKSDAVLLLFEEVCKLQNFQSFDFSNDVFFSSIFLILLFLTRNPLSYQLLKISKTTDFNLFVINLLVRTSSLVSKKSKNLGILLLKVVQIFKNQNSGVSTFGKR
ncbi:hypothetical protein GEMRC1_002916 [Eukaryota sp. GEM-RC1]